MKPYVALLFLCFLPVAHAAIIQGIVYDMQLNPAYHSVVRINTVPEQLHVAIDGAYSFRVESGNYSLSASYSQGARNYVDEQNITVQKDGNYTLDLLLYPDISEEQNLVNEDIPLPDIATDSSPSNPYVVVITIAVLAACLGLAIYFFKPKPKPDTDDLPACVIQFIKDAGCRTTQKDIRKHIGMSEAKISLVLTELESRGKIQKIKKGKGNIIILDKP